VGLPQSSWLSTMLAAVKIVIYGLVFPHSPCTVSLSLSAVATLSSEGFLKVAYAYQFSISSNILVAIETFFYLLQQHHITFFMAMQFEVIAITLPYN
jgi:hypothetical protein